MGDCRHILKDTKKMPSLCGPKKQSKGGFEGHSWKQRRALVSSRLVLFGLVSEALVDVSLLAQVIQLYTC